MKVLYLCPECEQAREWTDGKSTHSGDDTDEYWCQVCGAEVPIEACTEIQVPRAIEEWANDPRRRTRP